MKFVLVDKLPEGTTKPLFYYGYVGGCPLFLDDQKKAREFDTYEEATRVADGVRADMPGQIVFVMRLGVPVEVW
jgi:hypothetical protein